MTKIDDGRDDSEIYTNHEKIPKVSALSLQYTLLDYSFSRPGSICFYQKKQSRFGATPAPNTKATLSRRLDDDDDGVG